MSYSLSTVARQSALETSGAAHLGSTVQKVGMSSGAGLMDAGDANRIVLEDTTHGKRRQSNMWEKFLSAISQGIVEALGRSVAECPVSTPSSQKPVPRKKTKGSFLG